MMNQKVIATLVLVALSLLVLGAMVADMTLGVGCRLGGSSTSTSTVTSSPSSPSSSSSSSSSSSAGAGDNAPTSSSSAVCRALVQQQGGGEGGGGSSSMGGQLYPSADATWGHNLDRILEASQLHDPHYVLRDFTFGLLQLVSPRLHRSLQATPRDWTSVRRVLDVAEARWRYLHHDGGGQQEEPPEPPPRPVRIIVLGGSVTKGAHCESVVRDMEGMASKVRMSGKECSWPNRLQGLLDQLFPDASGASDSTEGQPRHLVEVTNLAIGGTNTEYALKLFWEYGLIPPEVGTRNPDIVLVSYGTNEVHITMTDTRKRMQNLQEFVRTVWGKGEDDNCPHHHHHRPLILNVEDFVGNSPMEILTQLESEQTAVLLADYYGFGSVSYPAAIRHLYFGDTREEWFSPYQWWRGSDPNDPNAEMPMQMHPGMGMHIATAWICTYYFLHVATLYCTLERTWNLHSRENDDEGSSPYATSSRMVAKQRLPPRQSSWNQTVPGRPGVPPWGLPPPLTPQLGVKDVTRLWREGYNSNNNEPVKTAGPSSSSSCSKDGDISLSNSTSSSTTTRCIFSWLSGLQTSPLWIEKSFRDHSIHMVGWELDNDHKKLGYVPTPAANASSSTTTTTTTTTDNLAIMEFANVTQPILTVLFFYMKSYGQRWEGSKLSLQTEVFSQRETGKWETMTTHELIGSHSRQSSETYTEEIALPGGGVPRGGSLRLRYEFKGLPGTTFKIQGLAVCS